MSWLDQAMRQAVREIARRCPPGWKLTRAVSEGSADDELEAHLARCPRCAAERNELRELVDHAALLPSPVEMSRASRQAMSARLLGAPPAPRVARRPRLGVALACAAAAAAAIAIAIGTGGGAREVGGRQRQRPGQVAQLTPAPTPVAEHVSRAAVRAVGAARFVRVQAPPDEIIRLDEGTIVLEVASLPRGERFRVQTDDGVVEVRGTRFEVSAAQRKLVAVSVSKGRVEVRSEAGALAVLDPGDEWVHNPTPTLPTAAAAVAAPAPSPRVSPKLPASEPATREQATRAAKMSFDRAWSLLRQGHARDAAALFAEVERVARDAGTREDALYWRAVATARTGDAAEAQRLFVDLLKRFPRASRSGQAATALGWLLLDSGDPAAASRAFERAINDQSPAIRASAAEGLRRAAAR